MYFLACVANLGLFMVGSLRGVRGVDGWDLWRSHLIGEYSWEVRAGYLVSIEA